MLKIFFKPSIASKYFIMIFALIVLPIFGFFLFARLNTSEISLAQKQTSDLVTLDILSSNIETRMEAIEVMGNLLSHDKGIINFFEQANQSASQEGIISYKNYNSSKLFPTNMPTLNSVVAIACMDYNGIFIGQKTLNKNRLSYFFNATLMREIQATNNATWTKSFSIEFETGHNIQEVFALAVPVTDNSSKPLGYITIFVSVESLSSLLEPYKDDIYILEQSYIISSKKDLPANTSLFSEMNFSYSLLLEDSSVIVRTSNNSLIVTTKKFPPLDLHLLLTSAYEDFSTNVATSLPSLLTFLLYGIIFAFVSSLLIARIQARPILQMQNLMNKVKKGDFSLRLKTTTNDEFGELGLTLNSLLDRIQESMAEQKRQQQIQQKMELQLIQEQVKPHFLYNVLEIISSMIRCDLNSEALATVEQLANFYRISLSSGSDIISISSEIQLIENYLSLQKTRYVEFMDYVLAISPVIYQYAIPKLTLQPLIENAIYHGIKEKDAGGFLCISGYLENQRVVFEVFDTGKGIAPDKLKDVIALTGQEPSSQDVSPHFGVASIVRRLNILHDEKVSFSIDSNEHEYTCVTISFPAIAHGRTED